MEIELENCLKLSLNINNHTATITESPKVTGDLFIPRSIKHEGIEYLIISVGSLALASTQIDSLEFAEDSCVETFDSNSFCYSKIKKLQIPPKLTTINHYWAIGTINLSYIEVSPKNKLFQFIDNQYLVGKSQNESDTFDVLIYACYNITEAIIPPQIKILR
ncbi:hypothetical protein M9Y10_021796 [Tritrichomonas musculus]|uniref:Uncharacterized protein n=1 Tax=Tritrichomonas musculus TaxID=1915356 RepID=A0ABR2KQE6_9EUKA